MASIAARRSEPSAPSPNRAVIAVAVVLLIAGWAAIQDGHGWRQGLLYVIGGALGVTLYHAMFGFTSAWRALIEDARGEGVRAQMLMLALATVVFIPVLDAGTLFGRPVGGAVAPVGISVAVGAFLFGIGMQLGGGCASGTLFSAGGGSARMILVLVFFCLGAFWGSLDLRWWQTLPSLGVVSLGRELGWPLAVPLQLAALLLIYMGLRLYGGRNGRSLWPGGGLSWSML